MDPTDIEDMIVDAVAPLRDEIEALRRDLDELERRHDRDLDELERRLDTIED